MYVEWQSEESLLTWCGQISKVWGSERKPNVAMLSL